MLVRWTYHWRWGDKSTFLWDTNDPIHKQCVLRNLQECIDGKQPPDIRRWEWEVVTRIEDKELLELLTNDK